MPAPAAEPIQYHIHVVGKWQAPDFHKLRMAAEFLAQNRSNVRATIEGYFEAQYEIRLKKIAGSLGGAFFMCKPSNTLVYAIADDEKALYFANMDRFFEWAEKRFKYEDSTSMLVYKRLANKAQQQNFAKSRRYCQVTFQFGDREAEPVAFELFHKECPRIVNNFLALLQSGKYLGSPIHRIKKDCYIQGGDIVDGSGCNSVSDSGDPVPDDSYKYKHDSPGLLGMCKSKLDTNGSQFYVTLKELPMCDGKTVIFGRVITGMRTMWKISRMGVNYAGRPTTPVTVCAVRSDLLDPSVAEVGGPRVVPKAEPVKETAVAEEVPTRAPAGETADEQAAREAKEDEAAATKVQSLYRGKRDRAEVQAKMQAKKEQEERERAEEEEAATRVQALYKGKKARAKVQNMKEVKYASADANAASGDDAEA